MHPMNGLQILKCAMFTWGYMQFYGSHESILCMFAYQNRDIQSVHREMCIVCKIQLRICSATQRKHIYQITVHGLARPQSCHWSDFSYPVDQRFQEFPHMHSRMLGLLLFNKLHISMDVYNDFKCQACTQKLLWSIRVLTQKETQTYDIVSYSTSNITTRMNLAFILNRQCLRPYAMKRIFNNLISEVKFP